MHGSNPDTYLSRTKAHKCIMKVMRCIDPRRKYIQLYQEVML